MKKQKEGRQKGKVKRMSLKEIKKSIHDLIIEYREQGIPDTQIVDTIEIMTRYAPKEKAQ